MRMLLKVSIPVETVSAAGTMRILIADDRRDHQRDAELGYTTVAIRSPGTVGSRPASLQMQCTTRPTLLVWTNFGPKLRAICPFHPPLAT
jgi:hypothetical protein